MGFVIDFLADSIAQFCGMAIGRNRPWWMGLLAYFGCLATLVLPIAMLWVMLLALR